MVSRPRRPIARPAPEHDACPSLNDDQIARDGAEWVVARTPIAAE